MNNWITFRRVCIGSSHRSSQLPCQDAMCACNTPHLVLSVAADGVGSLCNSHIAAEAAVNNTVKWFEENYLSLTHPDAADPAMRSSLIPALQQSIRQSAQANGVRPDTMDCNLTFACILPEFGYAIWGVLGDGAVCVFRKDRQYVLSAANAISANGTETILQIDAAEQLRLGACPLADGQLLGFIITSDGLEGEIYNKTSLLMRNNAQHYFNAMLYPTDAQREEAILALLNQLPRELDDDISLGIISNAGRSQSIALPPYPTWLCTCGTRNALGSTLCTNCSMNFQQLYGDVDFGSSVELFFLELNQDPQRESALLRRNDQIRSVKINHPRQRNRSSRSANQTKEAKADIATPAPSGQSVVSTRRSIPMPPKQSRGQNNEDTVQTSENNKSQPADPQPKHPDNAPFRLNPTVIFACIATIWLVILSILLFCACHRISVLEDQLSSYSPGLSADVSPVGRYSVASSSAKLMRMTDGQIESVLTRLEEGSILERLDHQTFTIGDVVYVHVRTADGLDGWCNLSALNEEAP